MKEAAYALRIKEHLKSALLVLLILNAVFLAAQYWILNSSGTPGSVSLKVIYSLSSYFSKGTQKNEHSGYEGVDNLDALFMPSTVFLRAEGANYINPQKFDSLLAINSHIKSAIGLVMDSPGLVEKERLGEEDFKSLLKDSCLFVDYTTVVPGDMYMEFLGYENAGLKINSSSFRYAVFSKEGDFCTLSLYDPYLKRGLSYVTRANIVEDLYKEVKSELLSDSKSEFLMNQKEDSLNAAIGQELSLWPWTIMRSTLGVRSILANDILSNNRENIFEIVVRAFSYNTATIRKYEDTDGSLVYVEDFGILSLWPTGDISFEGSKDGGISIAQYVPAGDEALSNLDMVKVALRFLGNIGLDIIGKDAYIKFESMTYDKKSETYLLSFGYAFDGMPINGEGSSSIKIAIKDAKIVGVKMAIKNYSVQGSEVFLSDTSTAAKIIAYGSEKRPIRELRMVYEESTSGDIRGVWLALS